MSDPKQQHFVPQVYLQHFSVGKQIYFYDQKSKKTALANIGNVAKEKDFYTDISQEDKYFYENYYSRTVEPVLGKLLDRIITSATLCNENAPLLSDNDRSSLSKMLVYQMLRTRASRNFMQKKAHEVAESIFAQAMIMPEMISNKDFRAIVEDSRTLDKSKFKEIALPVMIDETRVTRYSNILDSMVCTFYENRTDSKFITSDNPVTITRLSTNDLGLGEAGLGYLDCVLAYPINPRIAAVLFHRDFLGKSTFLKRENRKVPITQKEIINTLNRCQCVQASRQVYSQTPFEK